MHYPHPYRHNTCNIRYNSETEESYTPRHLHIGSIELHQHPDTTTYDEKSPSDTDSDYEQSLSDTDSVASSVPQSEDEHSLMDYYCTPMPTFSSPCNMEDTVSTPPTPHPRCLKTYLILLPRPSKVVNNNTNSLQPAAGNCQMSIHREVPHAHAHSQPGKHLFYQHHMHNISGKCSLQDHHHAVTVNNITSNTHQDH